MDRLIWTAMTGMSASMAQQRVIANNMANAQTAGFRAETMQFTPMTLQGPSLEARAMIDGSVSGADMTPGSVSHTGRALDVALTGNAMLAVQAEDGSEAYTRRGDLMLGPGGLLVTGDGHPVIGGAGPVTVPATGKVSIGEDGSVLVADPAAPDQPPTAIDRVKLADPGASPVAKGLDGLFRVVGGGVLPGNEEARLEPGALEQSNVNTGKVLTQMIEAQRLFEMRTKLVATAREIDEGGASLLRMNA